MWLLDRPPHLGFDGYKGCCGQRNIDYGRGIDLNEC